MLYEGGDATDADRPAHRRYLRVEAERATAYQSFAVLATVPREWAYPDGKGEVLARLSDAGFALDWCVRIRPTANAAAQSAITGAIRQLSGQFSEYDGDLAGAPDSLAESIETMRAEVARLASSPSIPELQVSVVLGMGAADLPALEGHYDRLRAVMEANEYAMPRPTGDQRALWSAMLPGAPEPAVCRDYTQFMLPGDLAGCAPFTGSALGDGRGAMLGLNLDAGEAPVLFWAGSGPNRTNDEGGAKSGSIGVFGALGAGKSVASKAIIVGTVEMGGRVIVTVDRTPMGEYPRLAPVLAAEGYSTQVIRLGEDSDVCLDPLVVFTSVEDRVRYGTGFLTLLTGTPPTDPQGAVLAEAVRRVACRGGRLGDVVADLRAAGDADPVFAEAARTVALKVAVFTRSALARLVFGDGPAVRLDADYSVFWAPNLSLPSREAMADRRQVMPEQVFGGALLYLVTAVASSVAFSDRARFSLVAQDEGYVLDTPQGRELLDLVMRDGRKHNAALLFASHHPDDLDPKLQELLGSRFLFRTSREAAPAGLAFMGMEATEANIDDIDETRRGVGQCLYRDLAGRLGLLQILPPQTAALEAAFDTGLSAVGAARGADRPVSHRGRARVARSA